MLVLAVLLAAVGPNIVLDPPLGDCLSQRMPVPATALEPLVPLAAAKTHLNVTSAQSHGQKVWLLETGMGFQEGGEWARVWVRPVSDRAADVCYLGKLKYEKDAFESPVRVWQHFMAQLTALTFPVWAGQK
jgi:hypothetical protein